MEIFGNWREAEVVAEKWRKFYNRERPHSSLSYQTPDELKSYWDCYYRTSFPKKENYVGFKILNRITHLNVSKTLVSDVSLTTLFETGLRYFVRI